MPISELDFPWLRALIRWCAAALDAYQRERISGDPTMKEPAWMQGLIIAFVHLPSEVRPGWVHNVIAMVRRGFFYLGNEVRAMRIVIHLVDERRPSNHLPD